VKQKNTRFCIVGVVALIFVFELMGNTPAPHGQITPDLPTSTETPLDGRRRSARANGDNPMGDFVDTLNNVKIDNRDPDVLKASLSGPNLGKMLKRPIKHESEEFIRSPHPSEVPLHPRKP